MRKLALVMEGDEKIETVGMKNIINEKKKSNENK